jgi:AcrR family transcriptional regulator
MMPGVSAAPKGPHEPRRRQATDAILDATTDLLVELGVHGFSLGDVEARCGRKRALIIHYFKSRTGLLEAVTERLVVAPTAVSTEVSGMGLAEVLRSEVAEAVHNPTRAKALTTLACSAALPVAVKRLAMSAQETRRARFREAIQHGKRGGRAADDPMDAAEADFILAALAGIILSSRTANAMEANGDRLVAMLAELPVISVVRKKRLPVASEPLSPAPPLQPNLFDN